MKKLFTLILALVMLMSLSTAAFADNNYTIDVQAIYKNAISEGGDMISVDVAWGAMVFTYTVEGTKVWNPLTHDYDIEGEGGSWSCAENANIVTVTNHSNVAVKATLSFAADEAHGISAGKFDTSELLLATGEGVAYDKADSASAYLSLEGTLSEAVTNQTSVGTITVTITKQ